MRTGSMVANDTTKQKRKQETIVLACRAVHVNREATRQLEHSVVARHVHIYVTMTSELFARLVACCDIARASTNFLGAELIHVHDPSDHLSIPASAQLVKHVT